MNRIFASALLAGLLAGCTQTPALPVDVKILAINDFHGNLKPSSGGIRVADPTDKSKQVVVPAGGSESMATLVKQLRAKQSNSIFVAAGDLIGASPLLSALFHDEPTVESMSLMSLEVTSVGNHEFDEGKDELLRMQNGGCHPKDGCKGPHEFQGAKFRYLAASTIDTRTGKTIFPAYYVKEFSGIPVAFIGLTLKGTPDIVMPAGVAGLRFDDEADTVNALVPQLKKQGIEAIVVLIHEGGAQVGDYNECNGISGSIVDIVKKLDKAVDLVISGHTHRAYNCVIDGRLVTSGDKYGTIVTEIDVKLDPKTHDVIQARANNVIVRTDTYAKDPAQTALIADYERVAAPLINRVVGRITASLTRDANPAGETSLGEAIADSQLAATRAPKDGGAVVAFMNPGGVRADLPFKGDGSVTYGDVFAGQPFGNALVVLDMTGTQIKTMLEQQWLNQVNPRILHVSQGFTYSWDAARPAGSRVVEGSIKLNGVPLTPQGKYRVAMNEFLASGGDGFVVIKEATNRQFAMGDADAMEEYVTASSPLAPPKLDRIQKLN